MEGLSGELEKGGAVLLQERTLKSSAPIELALPMIVSENQVLVNLIYGGTPPLSHFSRLNFRGSYLDGMGIMGA